MNKSYEEENFSNCIRINIVFWNDWMPICYKRFWVAQGLPFTEDGGDCLFVHADGWDLDELHENIREAIREHCIVFDGE